MLRRESMREYASGALWLLPSVAALVALVAGYLMALIDVGPDSPLAPFAFQGTADDARSLLISITSTVVTVIALVLGLTVVALQLSSTQFSPRLLRNFLRDRPTQVVLSVFLATFAYSAAGLYTVGVAQGARTQDYPRLAVSGAILLLFASLGSVVFFADHLAHSIQIDAITRRVERGTLAVVREKVALCQDSAPEPPAWSVPILATRSGYVQTAHPEQLLPVAAWQRVHLRLQPRVGEHVVAGTPLAWLWRTGSRDAPPDPTPFLSILDSAVHIGFERTLQQDAAFGIRQLVDVACKALSPAVNDPYTAVQAVDHLSVIFSELAQRSLGAVVLCSSDGTGEVSVPGRRFADYLSTMCGLVRRYGSHEPTVSMALIRLLHNVDVVLPDALPDADERRLALQREVTLVLQDTERHVEQPADLVLLREAVRRFSWTDDPARSRTAVPDPARG